ncbi:MAG TPA: MATE family efflux transporter [Candidatus Eisenbergiella merdigallinarum]|uniref:MATE family efflux transporter n=1 Tax=Candidatus Eisenbergiella merdigallinarum TaxID=2838552 RepID=A0A9D2MRC0_9FIRM|nr:MATE family efflux transporter [Candidatus Eisenbergiella merdigallinarum]
MTKDMTQGHPGRLILGFAVPLLFGNLFQQFYNLMDTLIVGKFLGVTQLAAVGATGSVNFLIIGFCTGICSGFAIPISQKFGAKDESGMRRYIANSVWVSAAFTAVLTVLTVALCRTILVWMKTPADIIDDSYAYIVIIFAGIPVTILYNLTSAIIRSMGDSKTPVIFLVLAALLNIVLDLFCILALHMGVAGAAVATVISQAVSGVCCLVYMRKKYGILRMSREELRFSPRMAGRLIVMGVPMGLQYSVTAIGSVVLQSAVNALGSMAVASVTAAGKISMFFCCPFDALGATMATFAGQNAGAGKPDRIRRGLRAGNLFGIVYAAAAFAFLAAAGGSVALLFVDSSETEILKNVQMMLTANGAFYIALVFVNNVRFLIQGIGYSGLAIFSGASEMVARAVAGFLLVPVFGFSAVCFANPLAWVMADLFLIPACFFLMKRTERELAYKKPGQ